jgi:hypothetical protein
MWNKPVSWNDPGDLALLSAAVSAWEPCLEVCRPPRDALLYEPDGTLYAVCLADGLTLTACTKTHSLSQGDLVVIPQAFAVDAGPKVDFLAVRHLGEPPDHFRERFLQTWGVDVRRATWPAAPGLNEVVAESESRLRFPYTVASLGGTERSVRLPPGAALMCVALEGRAHLEGGSCRLKLEAGQVVAVKPGPADLFLSGQGRIGILTLTTEIADEARRRLRPRNSPGASPEFRPGEVWSSELRNG